MDEVLSPEILAELGLDRFVALDLETTGLDPEAEEIIEFGGVLFENGREAGSLNFLIKPSKPIPRQITQITGLSDADVREALPWEARLPEIRSFVGDLPLVAHNADFDLKFLEYHARRVEGNFAGWDPREKTYVYFANLRLDTRLLARMFLPFLASFSLSALARFYQVEQPQAHRALPDARVAGQIFLKLLEVAVTIPPKDVQEILRILEPTEEPVKLLFERLAFLHSSGRYRIPDLPGREKFTIQANFYNIVGEEVRPGTGKLEGEPIDEEAVAHFFEADGELARRFRSFEHRPQQVAMARAVAEAFNQGQFLVVEAGTGTGKSLAYLLPAIQWALTNEGLLGKVIISTNTKNLQEQLFFKDLPILSAVLNRPFKAVLLKGKGNYLCLDKWTTVLRDLNFRLAPHERSRVLPLYFWAQQTQTGDIAENNGFQVERNAGLWSKFIAENNYCPGRSCKFYDRCFLMRARNQAKEAHLVLVNHSLLFSDLAAEQAVLDNYVNLIIDEAHNIEKTATDYLGIQVTLWDFREFFTKLYSKDRMETGILLQLKKRLQLASMNPSHQKALLRMVERLIDGADQGRAKTHLFFRKLAETLREAVPENNTGYGARHRYTRESGLFKAVEALYEEFAQHLKQVQSELNDVIEYLKNLPEETFEYQKQIAQDLAAQFVQLDTLINNLQFLMAAEWDNFVYWFELPSRADSDDCRLYAAPLNVSTILSQKLYAGLRTAVFTSATLAVDRSFKYFRERVGLNLMPPERVNELLLDSPFNYQEQVWLGVPNFVPEPSHPEFLPAVKRFISRLVQELPRGTLVLFTSYSMLNNVYQAVRDVFEAERIPLLGQGIHGSRHALINQFKEVEQSFLFGTDSFWEGVDVPGKALEVLLITRLPFDVPSDPVIQAKTELIRQQGGNPFMDFTIPEAVIKFRQGFGRLIRNRQDFGAIIILDTRV
ncbi:MAG: DEAD/DEAH box helicase, partial [Calditrichaeota bacterium]